MRVLRMERRTEPMRGVYAGAWDGVSDAVERGHPSECGWDDLPSPRMDKGIGRHVLRHEVCCCATVEQFAEWWPDPVLALVIEAVKWGGEDVRIVVLDGDGIEGDKQAIIQRDRAVVVRSVEVEEYFSMSPDERASLLQGDSYVA